MKLDFVKKFLKVVDDALFPKNITCDACGGELVVDTKYRLCAKCMEKLPLISGPVCKVCGAPLVDDKPVCSKCREEAYSFGYSRSPLIYEGVAKELIYEMKYLGKKYIADTLAIMMADCYKANEMEADAVVFVPMTKKEQRKRGFNQSELLANAVAEKLDLPVIPALIKVKETPPKKIIDIEDRKNKYDEAFQCVSDDIKGKNILVVDDIMFAGVTINESAKTLLAAGANSVNALVCAVDVFNPKKEVTSDEEKEMKHDQKLMIEKQDVKIEIIEE